MLLVREPVHIGLSYLSFPRGRLSLLDTMHMIRMVCSWTFSFLMLGM